MLDKIDWCYSDRVICAEFSGFISFDEIKQALYHCGELFTQITHQQAVHVIFDHTNHIKIDTRLTNLTELKEIYAYQRNPTGGQFVLVDPSMHPLLRSIGTIAARLAHEKLVIAPTIDVALRNLHLIDSSIKLYEQDF